MESNEAPLQLYDLSTKGVKTSSIHESFLGMTRLPGYSDINVKGDILKTPKNTQMQRYQNYIKGAERMVRRIHEHIIYMFSYFLSRNHQIHIASSVFPQSNWCNTVTPTLPCQDATTLTQEDLEKAEAELDLQS